MKQQQDIINIEATKFNRWKKLFFGTVDEIFAGNEADEAKWRAEKMAEMFQMKIKHHQNKQVNSLLQKI